MMLLLNHSWLIFNQHHVSPDVRFQGRLLHTLDEIQILTIQQIINNHNTFKGSNVSPWAHLLSFLLMKQSTVVAENVFAGNLRSW